MFRANFPIEPLAEPRQVLALDDHLLTSVKHRTSPLALHVSCNNLEMSSLHVIFTPSSPIILGIPWLRLHDPLAAASITNWSAFCHSCCLCSASGVTWPPSPHKPIDMTNVPTSYHNLSSAPPSTWTVWLYPNPNPNLPASSKAKQNCPPSLSVGSGFFL